MKEKIGLGSSSGWEHCIVTLYSYRASSRRFINGYWQNLLFNNEAILQQTSYPRSSRNTPSRLVDKRQPDGHLVHMQTLFQSCCLPLFVFVKNISHEKDLIFIKMNAWTCDIHLILHKDSFCRRGKFILELIHPLVGTESLWFFLVERQFAWALTIRQVRIKS